MMLAQAAFRYGGGVAARASEATKTREEWRSHVPQRTPGGRHVRGGKPVDQFHFLGKIIAQIQAALREQNER